MGDILGQTFDSLTQFGLTPQGVRSSSRTLSYPYIKAPVRYFASLTPELSNSRMIHE
jgi:hypothetical protein